MPAPEEPLHGGHNATEVVRVGDTVRRARDSNAAFAARVLRHLESAGYPYAPRHLGIDERGRDVLGFITGATTDHPAQRAPGAYARGGRMLRELHEATAGHMLAAGRECVVHGDPGPFNTVFRDGLPVAFIDWSSCRPGDRLDPALPAARRRHARAAIGWAVSGRELVLRHRTFLLAVLRGVGD
ncbi:phosphotransferase [Nonomuraea sp. K271]|uniref:phosphotransferase n=1 Tax=Nonomuraea sp. K271 TaxID=1848319 RepID=UPI001378B073|nr:phosphotransferase [Nonomuraea sp. K271]NBE91973.1 phosphotransferase [Nonomuraea sp. K271]